MTLRDNTLTVQYKTIGWEWLSWIWLGSGASLEPRLGSARPRNIRRHECYADKLLKSETHCRIEEFLICFGCFKRCSACFNEAQSWGANRHFTSFLVNRNPSKAAGCPLFEKSWGCWVQKRGETMKHFHQWPLSMIWLLVPAILFSLSIYFLKMQMSWK